MKKSRQKFRTALAGVLLGLAAPQTWAQEEVYRVVAESYPPYEYVENGQAQGWDLEMVERAAQAAGVRLVYEFLPWARANALVRAGTADAIMSLRKSPERELYLIFPATPLGPGKSVLLAGPSFGGHPTTMAELAGSTVGTTAANFYGPIFENAPGLKRVVGPDQETLLRRVADGTLPLAVMNEPVARFLVAKHRLEGVRFLAVPLDRADLYIAFSRVSPRGKELAQRLGAALLDLQASGGLQDLREKYLPEPEAQGR